MIEHLKVVVKRSDGGVTVMSFATLGRGSILPRGALWHDEKQGIWKRDPSDANLLDEVMRSHPSMSDSGQALPVAVGYRVLGKDEVLPGRDFRDAWVDRDGAIDHDMAKAREIHRDRLRHARAPLLAALDVEVARSDEVKDPQRKDAAIAKKQALRDVTALPAIDAAQSVEELKAITLEALGFGEVD